VGKKYKVGDSVRKKGGKNIAAPKRVDVMGRTGQGMPRRKVEKKSAGRRRGGSIKMGGGLRLGRTESNNNGNRKRIRDHRKQRKGSTPSAICHPAEDQATGPSAIKERKVYEVKRKQEANKNFYGYT